MDDMKQSSSQVVGQRIFGVAVTSKSAAFGYHAIILFDKTTEGSQATEIGDALSYNAAITFRLYHDNHASHDHSQDNAIVWDFPLELNSEDRSRNKLSNIPEEHSGGGTIFLAPGIRVPSSRFGGVRVLRTPRC